MDKKLGKNLALNMIYNVLSIVVPFITAPYLGRILGAEQVGEYTYFYSIASYFVLFGLLGISNYGTRSIAQVRDSIDERSKAFFEIYAMQIISGGVVTFVYVGYALIVSSSKLESLVLALFVCSSILDVNWFCAGMEKFKEIVIRNTIVKLANLLCIFAFVRNENCFIAYVIIMALSYFLSPLLLWPSILNEIHIIKIAWKDVIKHFKPNIVLFIPAIASSIYQIMDKVMIGFLASNVQLAYYEYADKIIQIPNVVFGSIGAVMLSRMSHVVQNDEKNTNSMIGYSMDISALLSCGFIFGILAIADEFVLIYYGPEFSQSSIILSLLAPVIFLYGWNNVLRMQYIIPKSFDMIYIKSTFAGAIVNLILNAIFIPKMNAVGATIGTAIAQFTIFAFYWFQLRKYLPLIHYLKSTIPVIIVGSMMFICVKAVGLTHSHSIVGLILDIMIGGTSYLIGCFVLGILGKNRMMSLIVNYFRERCNVK